VVPRPGRPRDLPRARTQLPFPGLALGEGRYVAAAYFVPLAYAAIAYGGVWASRQGGWNSEFVALVAQRFGLRGMPPWGSLTLYVCFMATAGMIRSLSTALGEEIGWRGFLVPKLAK
jgi:hypothetical protein